MSHVTKGVNRATLPDGTEIAYIDKGIGNPLGIPRARYEEQGYEPAYDDLPEKK